MSRRRESDYSIVVNHILSQMRSPRVSRVVADFEKAVWRSFKNSLPNAMIKGCSFHFTQTLYRHVQEMGLVKRYRSTRTSIRQTIRRLMALCYLPGSAIPGIFHKLKEQNQDPELDAFFIYLEKNWITSRMFPPKNWSVYKTAIRTNNDAEGYHNRLNRRGRENMSIYLLIPFLFSEAEFCETQLMLISSNKLQKRRRKNSRETDAKLYKLWGKFQSGRTTSWKMLKAASKLIGPCA